MSKKILISLSHVSFRRGTSLILKSIDWDTQEGEHWFVMGNNGSGKTTLMEVLMGYLWPQEGSVTILGKKFGHVHLQELRREIGYVSPWIFKRMPDFVPVQDIVASGMDASVGYFSEISPSLNMKIKEKLNFFDCDRLINRPFGTLSSGQQFKVIMARSLVHDPAVLILDEPFSLLDIGSRYTMYRYIDLMGEKDSAPQIIMVTHHFDDITSTFTHGLLMKDGRIYHKGPKDSVLEKSVLAGAFDIPDDMFSAMAASMKQQ